MFSPKKAILTKTEYRYVGRKKVQRYLSNQSIIVQCYANMCNIELLSNIGNTYNVLFMLPEIQQSFNSLLITQFK